MKTKGRVGGLVGGLNQEKENFQPTIEHHHHGSYEIFRDRKASRSPLLDGHSLQEHK